MEEKNEGANTQNEDMKNTIEEWLEVKGVDLNELEFERANWVIETDFSGRNILIGNPKNEPEKIDIAYKGTLDDKTKEILKRMEEKERQKFKNSLIFLLTGKPVKYRMEQKEGCINSVMVSEEIYKNDLTRTKFYRCLRRVRNMSSRVSLQFASLHKNSKISQDQEPEKAKQSIYR